MNSVEVLATEPGRELDALVSENIMLRKVYRYSDDWYMRAPGKKSGKYRLPKYSTTMSPAFQVVSKMLEDSLSLELIVGADGVMARFFDARILDPNKAAKGEMVSETIPEAVCKAALLCK